MNIHVTWSRIASPGAAHRRRYETIVGDSPVSLDARVSVAWKIEPQSRLWVWVLGKGSAWLAVNWEESA